MEKLISFDDSIDITSNEKILAGKLVIPEESQALIIFVDDKGSVLHDQRSLLIAERLQKDGFATLFVDLLTRDESANHPESLDINHLANRITDILNWTKDNPHTDHLNAGIFSYNTGTAAALKSPSYHDNKINALVSLGGRPDMALEELKGINVPMLFITGDLDNSNVSYHEKALPYLNAASKMEVLEDGGKGFEEPVIFEKVVSLTKDWFITHL